MSPPDDRLSPVTSNPCDLRYSVRCRPVKPRSPVTSTRFIRTSLTFDRSRLMALEAGKPTRDALVEVDRAALTFRLGAEEAERMVGETIPLDLMPASKGRVGITRRFPVGPVAGISPFNFPLNLAAHKISPAIASGCTIVLKP